MKSLLALLIPILWAPATTADEYAFCLLTNKVAATGQLSSYSTKQIENGLCMASKEVVAAIAAADSFKEKVCLRAAEYMMEEFVKRFPTRSVKDVIDSC
jgi:hypothetical protein